MQDLRLLCPLRSGWARPKEEGLAGVLGQCSWGLSPAMVTLYPTFLPGLLSCAMLSRQPADTLNCYSHLHLTLEQAPFKSSPEIYGTVF